MSHLLEYAAVRALEAGLGALPEGTARRLGAGLGELAYRRFGVRREVVERQIAASFPGRGAAWRREVAHASYRHFGEEFVAIARYARLDPRALPERTAGVEEMLSTYRSRAPEGRGGLIVTGHVGNWEFAGALLAGLGLPVAAVVRRQSNRRFDRRLQELRGRLGMEPVYMRDAARRVPRALEEGKVVALVADQDARGSGVFVPFLGRPASTYRGPAWFALRHGAPLLFGGLVREGEGYRTFIEPVDPPDGRGLREREEELTRRWVARLERKVREYPGQYFWHHRRWKTRPPGGAGSADDRQGTASERP